MTSKVCRGDKFSRAKLLYVGGTTNVSDGEEVDTQLFLGEDIDEYQEAGVINGAVVAIPLTFVGASWGMILDINSAFGPNNIEIIIEKPSFIKEFYFSVQKGQNRIGIFDPNFEPTIVSLVFPATNWPLFPENYFDISYQSGPLSVLGS